MSTKLQLNQVVPTHELEVKDRAKIKAFDQGNHRLLLEVGLYPCVRIQNPLVKDEDEVYELLDFEDPTYVRLDLLENQVDSKHWKVHRIDDFE